MKLLYCPSCEDIVKLFPGEVRSCKCGESTGEYAEDNPTNVILSGKAVPLSFENASFTQALTTRPESGKGSSFISFFLPLENPTVIYREPVIPQEIVPDISTLIPTPPTIPTPIPTPTTMVEEEEED